MRRSVTRIVAMGLLSYGVFCSGVQAQTPATWDGGNDLFSAAKWNGGLTAAAVFGDNRISNGAWNITIGGGSDVTYPAGSGGIGNGIRPRSNVGPTTMTIKEGARFYQTTVAAGDADGMWTTFDADLNLDNGTMKRDWQSGGNAQAGGILMLGSWRSVDKQQIDINITNGGKIENDGQIWFGADEEHAEELKVYLNIDNGTLDLTGGAYPTSNNTNVVSAELALWYGHDVTFVDANRGLESDGSSKNEDYRINFRGTGSITVDSSGIWVYRQDASGIWTGTQSTYQNLWDQGILRASGVTGGYLDPNDGLFKLTGRTFSNFFTVTGTSGTDNYTVTPKAQTTVTWDGGTGEWNDNALWNGGQTAVATMGGNQAGGTMNRGSDGGHAVVIDGSKPGGADVSFDPNPGTGAGTDFRMRVDNGLSSLTIKNGGKFRLHTASDIDGKWTRQGSDVTIDGAGSLYQRTKDGVNSLSGGVLLLGAFNTQYNQEMDINITNGGRLENDGQVWFGTDDTAVGFTVNVNINDGSVDLTGGDNYPLDLSAIGIDPDLAFIYGYHETSNGGGPAGPNGEKYTINFTGPGTFTVDHSGIYTVTEDSSGILTAAAKTYQQLWADGILQANGLSGLTGATFGDYFTVTGSHLSDNYILTSLIGGGGLDGDYNSDGKVDAADYVVWRNDPAGNGGAAGYNTWRSNFGATAGAGSGLGANAAVPEPTSLVLLVMGLATLGFRRRSA